MNYDDLFVVVFLIQALVGNYLYNYDLFCNQNFRGFPIVINTYPCIFRMAENLALRVYQQCTRGLLILVLLKSFLHSFGAFRQDYPVNVSG